MEDDAHIHHVPYGPSQESIPGGIPCEEWNAYILIIHRIARYGVVTDQDMVSWFERGERDRSNYETSGVYYDGRE